MYRDTHVFIDRSARFIAASGFPSCVTKREANLYCDSIERLTL